MPHPVDPAFEPGGPLASFAEDARLAAGGPPPAPGSGLLALMGAGIAVSTVTPREKPMFVKSLLGSLAAKVAIGVGLATASVTAAGAAGVLPAAAQHAVATAVEVTTPFQLPDDTADAPKTQVRASDDPVGSTTTSSTSTTSTSVPTTTPTSIAAPATTVANQSAGGPVDNHGACVSAIAHDPSLTGEDHGDAVSTVARSDCGKPSPTTTVAPTTTSTPSTTVVHNGSSTASNAKTGSDGKSNAGGNSGKN